MIIDWGKNKRPDWNKKRVTYNLMKLSKKTWRIMSPPTAAWQSAPIEIPVSARSGLNVVQDDSRSVLASLIVKHKPAQSYREEAEKVCCKAKMDDEVWMGVNDRWAVAPVDRRTAVREAELQIRGSVSLLEKGTELYPVWSEMLPQVVNWKCLSKGFTCGEERCDDVLTLTRNNNCICWCHVGFVNRAEIKQLFL